MPCENDGRMTDRSARVAGIAVPAAVAALLLASASVDHYFRDEFYYLACSHRLAWGYVDQPPLSIAVLWIARHAAGESLIVLRAIAALTLAATVALTGSLARRLGAGAFGQALAMVAIAISPEFLAFGDFYSMNVFDLLLWTLAVHAFLSAIERPTTMAWVLLGLVLGAGLLNKISVLWLGAGLGAALILTPARAHLRTRGPYVAAAIAVLLFLPHVLWQVANGWPTLEFIRNAGADKMQQKTPWAFLLEQVMNLHPLTLPVWGGGLAALLVARRLHRYRALAIVWLVVALILIGNRTSRSSYLLAAYPALFAAGGAWWEGMLVSRAARATVLVALIAAGAVTAPLGVSILPPDSYVRYSRALGVTPSTEEKKDLGRLPQGFADRQGWDAFVDVVAAVWQALPPEERADAAILAGNYGEAGAIERLGAARGLVVLSGHNNYWLWGPQGHSGRTMIVLSRRRERLATVWGEVMQAGETSCGDCMPYENHLPIYVCRRPRALLPELWPMMKHYD